MADGTITIDTKIDESQLDDVVGQVSSKLGQIEKNTGNAFAKMRDVMQGPVAALGMIKNGLDVMYNALIAPAAAIEDLEAAFTPLVGGAENAKEMIAALNKEAATTPFELEGIGKIAKQLLPVLGNDVKAVTETFRMLGDTAGGNIQKLDSITRGFMKSMLKGKVDMESLNMIAEAGVPIYSELASSMGITVAQMMEMSSKGKITSDDLTGAFQKMTSEGGIFFDGMNIASQTLNGQLSNLSDGITQAGVAIGSEMLPSIKELVANVSNIVDSFVSWATTNDNLGKTLENIKDVLITGAATLGMYALASGALNTALIGALVPAFVGLKAAIIASTRALLANPFGAIAVVLTAILVPAILLLIKHWDEVVVFIQTKAATLGQKLKILGVTIKSAFVVGFNSAKIAALQFATMIIDKVFGVVQKLLGVLAKLPGVGDMFKSVSDDVDDFKNKLKGAADQAIKDSQAKIDSAKAQKAAIIAEGNAEIAKIKQVGAVRMESVRNKKQANTEETQSHAQAMAAQDIAEQKVADKSTKRAEKKKKEQKEELVGIEKISKAYEDMVAKMDSSNASFLDGLKAMNDMLSTSIGGMSETLDLLSFAGPIGQATQFYEKILEVAGAIETIITVGPEKAVEIMDNLVNAVTGIIENLPALGIAVVKIIQTVFIKLVEALPDILTGLFESSMTMGPAMSIAITKAIPAMVKALALFPIELAKSVPDMVTSMGSAFYQMGIEIVKMIGNGIVSVGNLIKWIGEILPNPADIEPFNIGDIGRAIVNAIAAGINFAGSLFEKVRYYFEQFFSALKNFFINIPSIGAAIVDGIVNGIMSAPAIFGRVMQFFQDFIDGVKHFFLIASPSQIFAGIGGNIIDGIVEGILSAPDLFESTKDVFQSFLDAIKEMFKGAIDIGGSVVDGIKDGVDSAVDNVKDAGKGASDWVGDKTGWWKSGGYTGDGSPEEVAGFVHRGEYVLNADETKALGLNAKGASIQSIMSGLQSGGVNVPAPASSGANITINLNNVMNAVMQADGREIARLVFRNMDSVGGQYFGSQS